MDYYGGVPATENETTGETKEILNLAYKSLVNLCAQRQYEVNNWKKKGQCVVICWDMNGYGSSDYQAYCNTVSGWERTGVVTCSSMKEHRKKGTSPPAWDLQQPLSAKGLRVNSQRWRDRASPATALTEVQVWQTLTDWEGQTVTGDRSIERKMGALGACVCLKKKQTNIQNQTPNQPPTPSRYERQQIGVSFVTKCSHCFYVPECLIL